MTLDITMGHEGDLFALLDGLQDKAKGLFTVDTCDVEQNRQKRTSVDIISIDQMKARCVISWYTIKASE